MPECYYCFRAAGDTIDHRQPLSRGGSRAKHNEVPACRDCNGRKACLTEEEYLRLRVHRGLLLAAVTVVQRDLETTRALGYPPKEWVFDHLLSAARTLLDERQRREIHKTNKRWQREVLSGRAGLEASVREDDPDVDDSIEVVG